MADVFISYKREDREFAEQLAHALEQLGFDVWWDFDLLAGDQYRKVIREVIDKCSAAIVLWSGKSVESDFVMDEASHAKNRGKLCPARIDEVELPFGFGQTHTDDLIGWNGELTHAGFQGLVRSLETRAGRKAKLGAVRRSAESQAATAELEAFRAAQLAGNVTALTTFLREHPRGTFAGFVRDQIETMAASAPRPQAVEPAAARAPAREERTAEASPAPGPGTPSTSPWPKIAGIAIVVLGVGGLFMYHQNAQEEARRAQEELRVRQERLEQERRTREAAEARAKEVEAQAQKDREAREQAEAERIAMRKAEEERLAREKAEREKTAKEAERQRLAAAQAEQQRLAREQAERERVARERAAREAEASAKAAAQPAPFDLAQLHPDVRAAVERARGAERRAGAAAARARDAAKRGEAGSGGFGTTSYTGDSAGNKYAGQLEGRARNGLGVFSWGENSSNRSNSLRYEGEWVNDKINGFGMYFWRGGSRHAGGFRDGKSNGLGVYRYVDAGRLEGEWESGRPSGHAVRWSAEGRVVAAGIYTDGRLTTPLGPQGR